MVVLVTGGAGAIGGNLVDRLVGDDFFKKIVVLDDLSSGYLENIQHLTSSSRMDFIRGSIADDEILSNIFSQYKISGIFHLAANFANQNSVDYPRKDLDVNGMGTLKLLEYGFKAKIKRFVYSSSSCVYGSMGGILREDTREFSLDTPYAITKLLGERYVRFFFEYHKMDTVILRFFNAYGPGERPGKYRNVIPNFLNWAMQGKPLPITGTGEETRDFNFNQDTVSGIVAAMKTENIAGKIFNLASAKATPIKRIAEIVNEVTGNKAGVEFKGRRAWDTVTNRLASIDEAKKFLDYNSTVSIEKGIGLTYDWIKKIAEQLPKSSKKVC